MENVLLNQTSEEFDKIRELMQEEQKARDEGESMILNALKEVSVQI